MSGNKYPSYLIHYGRSIKDGAPGVGTGNWRRDSSVSYIQKKYNIEGDIGSDISVDGTKYRYEENEPGFGMVFRPRYRSFIEDQNQSLVEVFINADEISTKEDFVKAHKHLLDAANGKFDKDIVKALDKNDGYISSYATHNGKKLYKNNNQLLKDLKLDHISAKGSNSVTLSYYGAEWFEWYGIEYVTANIEFDPNDKKKHTVSLDSWG